MEPTTDEKFLLSGNQAIARAAEEAGVTLVTGYPGTPSTYVIETLLKNPNPGFKVEWAINEKVAFELAAGVSWAGKRSLATMKMSGLNVASDAFLSVQYSSTPGGLVLYVADDPNVYYGMVEQDSRYYARLGAAPMLTPCSPQEALDFTRRAFELSEQIGRPVMILGTTTLANTSQMVTVGEKRTSNRKASFKFNTEEYTKAGTNACIRQHGETLLALNAFGELTDDLNPLRLNKSRIGVIAAGITWNYLKETMGTLHLNPCTLKLGIANPLPNEKIKELLLNVDTVIVLEELEPLVEERVRAICGDIGRRVKIIGKMNGPLSLTGDYDENCIITAFKEAYGDQIHDPKTAADNNSQANGLKMNRLNTFCAGCPHRATYYALNRAMKRLGYKKDELIITGDIGCTILGMNAPFESCWTEVSMGSSISLAQGFKYAGIETPVVATIGDGTFFHGGIPALLNVSHNKTNLTIIILNNHYASMTGMQPNVGSGNSVSADGKQQIAIEDIVKASGIENVKKVNPFQSKKITDAMMAAISSPELSVIIADAECGISRKKRRKKQTALRIQPEKCVGLDGCDHSCIEVLGCPAIERGRDGKACIDPSLCSACGLCHHVCEHGAI